ncbi:hypothetical protein [Lysobacter sp. Root916]|uniref:hypothetical protein n=1 Tax=Lysobacter sp. Root916 TaxID=1736606 RepID=UPI00138F868A|nr:hypothetical protein [Lysobacter sp. Root916]
MLLYLMGRLLAGDAAQFPSSMRFWWPVGSASVLASFIAYRFKRMPWWAVLAMPVILTVGALVGILIWTELAVGEVD